MANVNPKRDPQGRFDFNSNGNSEADSVDLGVEERNSVVRLPSGARADTVPATVNARPAPPSDGVVRLPPGARADTGPATVNARPDSRVEVDPPLADAQPRPPRRRGFLRRLGRM